MAFPKDISKISTNLTPKKLSEVVAAVENKRVKWSGSLLYAGDRAATFSYRGEKFGINEWFEEVTSLFRR